MFNEKRNHPLRRDPLREGIVPPAQGLHGPARVPALPAVLAVLAAYLVFLVPTVYFAVQAYTPCTSNFEGGCSMGKALLALLSLVTAACASGTGVPLKGMALRRARAAGGSAASVAASLLWAVPLLYILITLRLVLFG